MTPTSQSYPRQLRRIVRGWAVLGGLGLVLAGVVTGISIIGRALSPLGLGPVAGDFELVELATGISVFGFLAWGHMEGQHVRIDVLSERFPKHVHKWLGVLSDCLVTLVSGVILWRLYLGFAEKFPYGSDAIREKLAMGSKPFFPETTYELQIEIWIPYALCLVGAALFFIVALLRIPLALREETS